MIHTSTSISFFNPPVVESEHVVIVLYVILIEQHVNLNNVCSGYYFDHFLLGHFLVSPFHLLEHQRIVEEQGVPLEPIRETVWLLPNLK